MAATAAHLTDHVLPDLPLRQWVLAVPKRLRYFLERDADLQGAALRLFLRAVESCLRAQAGVRARRVPPAAPTDRGTEPTPALRAGCKYVAADLHESNRASASRLATNPGSTLPPP